ncbi:MAG: hypothetical protein MZW92_78385 [Comamonadaceae bacterium]|nr:hypothetical protein [Comamonadaceae bacterium]
MRPARSPDCCRRRSCCALPRGAKAAAHASRSRRSSATAWAAASTRRMPTGNAAAQRRPRGRRQLGRRPRPVRDPAGHSTSSCTRSRPSGLDSATTRRSRAWTSPTEYYQFGGTLLFYPDEQWLVPYLSLTIGATRFSADDYELGDQVLRQPRRRTAPAVQRQFRGDAGRARLPDLRRFGHQLPVRERRRGGPVARQHYFQAEAHAPAAHVFQG